MLLFLHGFLGCKEDWTPVLNYLKKGAAIDLPLFEADIAKAILDKVNRAQMIIGYSAGGRIALEMKARFPDRIGRVIALSAHPGLFSEAERRARRKWDQKWIERLEQEPFPLFLKKWYDQPLFSSLRSSPLFPAMLKRRVECDPKAWAHFLRHHGLGQKQPSTHFSSTVYVFGSRDLKYASLYRKLTSIQVKDCGHAAHLENPKGCASIIESIYAGCTERSLARSKTVSGH